jgi:hypothetical protein
MPSSFDGPTLTLEGHVMEIVDADGLANRRYVWVPSLDAILGGVLVLSGVHVWTRAAWVKALAAMAARKPDAVVPGHMMSNAAVDNSSIAYTRDYQLAFEEELARANNSDELISAMTQRYPNAGMGIALQIGAKVATGEMQWGWGRRQSNCKRYELLRTRALDCVAALAADDHSSSPRSVVARMLDTDAIESTVDRAVIRLR